MNKAVLDSGGLVSAFLTPKGVSDVNLVTKLPSIKTIINDPNDDMVVACAVKAKANYIVTRDDDMLILKKYKWIKIVPPEEFIEILRKETL
ncbi:MAG TPA: hypothetical protein DCR39_02975 [Nitrospiraceae bacterium]|nr:hypothetical protein [Nitrospiraceae bacterium]